MPKIRLIQFNLVLDSYGRLPDNRRSFYLKARQFLVKTESAKPSDPNIVQVVQEKGLPLMSGIMLGDLADNGVSFWFRAAKTGRYQLSINSAEGVVANTTKEIKHPGKATIIGHTGLKPDTSYTYRLLGPSAELCDTGTFTTAPVPDSRSLYSIAFGSCYHKIGLHNPSLMSQITQRGNLAMLLLGDLAVDDREARLNMHYADYLLRDSSKAWTDFSSKIPSYASWDDHDYLNNDKSGLQKEQITNQQRNAMRSL